MHTFLKIPRPVDISDPLQSEFPIIPVLFVGSDMIGHEVGLKSLYRYKHPAGPIPGSPAAEISGDPEGM